MYRREKFTYNSLFNIPTQRTKSTQRCQLGSLSRELISFVCNGSVHRCQFVQLANGNNWKHPAKCSHFLKLGARN